MKKYLLMAAVAVLAFSSCKQAPEEERMAALEAKWAEFEDVYQTRMQAIHEDESLTVEQKEKEANDFFNGFKEECARYTEKAIRKNKGDKVALEAFKQGVYFLEYDQIEKLASLMTPESREDKIVGQYIKLAASYKVTAEGSMFKDFEVVEDPENAPEVVTKFSDFIGNGKYVLVDFWASWCGPCKREIPNIKAIYEKYAGDDFNVLSVAVWDDPEATKASAAEHGVVWDQIINVQGIAPDAYGFNSIPQIMLFGPDGTILKRNIRGTAVEKAVAEALGR